MPSSFSQATGVCRPAEVHVIGRPHPQRPLLQEEYRPLSLLERWSIGLGLIVAAIVIEVAEHLPRLDRFKPHHQTFSFPAISGSGGVDRRYSTVRAETVDVRRGSPRRPGCSTERPLRLVGPRD